MYTANNVFYNGVKYKTLAPCVREKSIKSNQSTKQLILLRQELRNQYFIKICLL